MTPRETSLPNLRHLHVFREVAQRAGISAAARAVHLSQPAITQAVAGLERHFGGALFRRGPAGIRLTEAGAMCLERVERALGQLHEGLAELTRSTAPREGRGQRSAPVRAVTAAQLRALIAVAEHDGFGPAAHQTGISAPSLHRAARQLERTLGAALFERTSFGVRPTREAVRLARRAQLAFGELEQARAELADLGGDETGRTVIGAMPLARSLVLPRTLNEFGAAHPGHAVAILEGTYEHLMASLRGGEADLVVGALRDPLVYEDVLQEWLFDDPLAIVMRAGHPLDGKGRLSMRALAGYPWIAPRVGSPLRAQFEQLFRSAGIAVPQRPIECNSLVVARGLLIESDRVMLLSAHQIHYELRAGLLVAVPLPGGQRLSRAIGLTVRREWRPTAAQRHLLQLLRAQSAALAPPPLTGRRRRGRGTRGARRLRPS